MAKLVYGLNQSLDGYVDHQKFRPSQALFRHFIEHTRDVTGTVYGRGMYEVMRYWDEDLADWDAEERDFAAWVATHPTVLYDRVTSTCQSLKNATVEDRSMQRKKI